MHQHPIQLFKKYLRKENISIQEFSQMSGMPETEVRGLMDGELPITDLRAHHLAAAFDTDVEIWLNGNSEKIEKELYRTPKRPSLLESD
jgi:plasmid maintenance system antidote protein VapI